MKNHTAIVDWYGPYRSVAEARSHARKDYEDGLYAVIGRRKHRNAIAMQYVGIAENLSTRIAESHHVISNISQEGISLWLGEVASPKVPGKKTKATDKLLDLAEWAHAYFLQLPMNERKRANPPDCPITVYNRWWCQDYETPHKGRPHRHWPDLIDYVGPEHPARVAWFGGRFLVKSVERFHR